MKTIFSSKRLTVKAPTTDAEWMVLFFTGSGIYYTIAGHFGDAMDAFQFALLFDIISRLPERGA